MEGALRAAGRNYGSTVTGNAKRNSDTGSKAAGLPPLLDRNVDVEQRRVLL
jgi:hypothetical protein